LVQISKKTIIGQEPRRPGKEQNEFPQIPKWLTPKLKPSNVLLLPLTKEISALRL